jgi:hypothetical protein
MAGIPGIRVQQWLPEWDEVPTDPEKFQSPPPREFYITSIRASQLRALSDVHQRDATRGRPRADDTSIQRTLEEDRTAEIRRYIRMGYPLSSLGKRGMGDEERRSLLKPGWLPSAIIANVVPAGHARGQKTLAAKDAIIIHRGDSAAAEIALPDSWTDSGWHPEGAYPLEIIDGQHRLSAFDPDGDDDFELPVVVFDGLDFSWQAYLFWTVNIKPKRINASLAFDLYPLLRDQDWLEAGESLNVYRETRAQELVEALWGDPRSVWYDRINMLGQAGMKAQRPVTQAAFVRSLTSSFVRPFRGYRGFGGLFGGAANNSGFNWPRGQQSAFLISAWNALANAIHENDDVDWAAALRGADVDGVLFESDDPRTDPAFVGEGTLLASDQGVRGFHLVLNDLTYLGQYELDLSGWTIEDDLVATPEEQFDQSFADLETNAVGEYLVRLSKELATFDWRNARAKGLSSQERELKMALRGAGGYNILRERVFGHLTKSADTQIAKLASTALELRNG